VDNLIEPKNDLVFIGVCGERFDLPQFEESKDKILARSAENVVELHTARGHRVDRNRDKIVKAFLASEKKPDWLMFLDSDMEFPDDIVYRLLVNRLPIVGGLYFHRGDHSPLVFMETTDAPDEWGRISKRHIYLRDEVYDFINKANVPIRNMAVAINGLDGNLLECDAIGTGAMMIHRSVLEGMEPPWFEYRTHAESEDLAFCRRAREELGLPIYVDLSTICGHLTLSSKGYAEFQSLYKTRGVAATNYTLNEAAEMLEDCAGAEDGMGSLMNYDPIFLADEWNKAKEDEGVRDIDFYTAQKTGALYVTELLHWNASPLFGKLREGLVGVENQKVLEIGSGIGSIAIQLAAQRCDVDAYEANSVLRSFSKNRLDWITDKEKFIGKLGEIEWHSSFRAGLVMDMRPGYYDLIVALDVLEHMDEKTIRKTMEYASMYLKPGGRMYLHNAWGNDSGVHPFHYDHSEIWPDIVRENDMFQLDDFWLIKQHVHTGGSRG
jgi:hypothetical protein